MRRFLKWLKWYCEAINVWMKQKTHNPSIIKFAAIKFKPSGKTGFRVEVEVYYLDL